jgi:hypothetical protein
MASAAAARISLFMAFLQDEVGSAHAGLVQA